jgi:hypothetical protein
MRRLVHRRDRAAVTRPPSQAVQVRLLRDALAARSASGDAAGLSSRPEGIETPTGYWFLDWACRLTGRRSACTRQMRVQLPPRSTVREWPGGGMADTRSSEGRAHRGVRVQVPPWSLLGATLSCGFKHRPSEGWLASSTLAWGTGGCLADSSAGSTKPGWQVRLLHDLLTARPSAGDWGSEPRSSWLDTSTGCS